MSFTLTVYFLHLNLWQIWICAGTRCEVETHYSYPGGSSPVPRPLMGWSPSSHQSKISVLYTKPPGAFASSVSLVYLSIQVPEPRCFTYYSLMFWYASWATLCFNHSKRFCSVQVLESDSWGFTPLLLPSPAVWPWASDLTSLSFGFLNCDLEVILSCWLNCFED